MILQNLAMGLISGALCATGGALKDAPHEGFKPLTFLRSPIVGLFWGIVSIWVTDNGLLAFAFCGYCERCSVEFWKIVRQKIPGKHEWKARGKSEWVLPKSWGD